MLSSDWYIFKWHKAKSLIDRDLTGLGFADDDDVTQSNTLSLDPDKADFEDPELLAIAEKLKELEKQSDSEDSSKSGDWCMSVVVAELEVVLTLDPFFSSFGFVDGVENLLALLCLLSLYNTECFRKWWLLYFLARIHAKVIYSLVYKITQMKTCCIT